MLDDAFESRVLRFEQAWRLGPPPEIADHLGGPSGSDAIGRARLLAELICVDLELRWKHRDAATLADYLERFPELGTLDQLPLGLIGEAYRARRLWGDRPSPSDFLAPFRGRIEAIRAELARVDAEIEAEAGSIGPVDRGPPSADPVNPWPGALRLSDRDFRLRRLIGAGRMGKVYQASPRDGGPDVAAKFLRKPLLRHAGIVRRFLGEARTVAGLDHPNIVGTRGVGRTPGGSYFLVMDLVAGPNLAEAAAGRQVPESLAIRWAIGISEALAHAHDRGVVHCDLKPANVLLDPSGTVRVTDFGLARSLAEGTPGAAEVEGTAPFMAPEQVSRSWGPIGPRTDVYGLGAVLFALLTGRPPRTGRSLPEILAAVVAATPVPSPARLRPGLSGPLVALCLRCLAKPPEARYASAVEARAALVGARDRPAREGSSART